MKCTGKRCPMQIGYDAENCKVTDSCPYFTKPVTNYEIIKSLSIDELAYFITRIQENAVFMQGDLFYSEIPSDSKAWIQWLNKEAKI